MRSCFLACAGLLVGVVGLLSASGCSKEVKADFPRPPATAAIPPSPDAEPLPEPPVEVEEAPLEEPEPEPEPELDEPEPEPPDREPRPSPGLPMDETALEPPSTQLATNPPNGDALDPEVISKLERAGSLLSSVGGRNLSPDQREQITAARGFVTQARRALDEGDGRRALVLADKGLILVEDVERTSRP